MSGGCLCEAESADRSGRGAPGRCGCLTVSRCIPRHNMTRLAHIVTERREDKRRDRREEERTEKRAEKRKRRHTPQRRGGGGEIRGESSGRSPRFFPFPFRLPFGCWRKTKKERPVSGRTGIWRAVQAPAIRPKARYFPQPAARDVRRPACTFQKDCTNGELVTLFARQVQGTRGKVEASSH